jgi:thiamine-phosphate pyrophosphorylase
MRRYYITDRRQVGGVEALLEVIRRNLAAGIDLVQIREKDLTTRELLGLCRRVVSLGDRGPAKILVNERVDVALACGADGVHLPEDSIAPVALRRITPPGFLIGVSCHSSAAVIRARDEGADFVVYGPVFAPLSKATSTPPVGLDSLRSIVTLVDIPVFALGGITRSNAPLCIAAGAAGIAAISLFQKEIA